MTASIAPQTVDALLDFIGALEEALGRKAKMNLLPIQPGDVPSTMADVSELEAAVGFRPTTTIREGIGRFVNWYKDYYGIRDDHFDRIANA